jgi:UDP-N-acetylmuramoylalanine--D-glutamate ligase
MRCAELVGRAIVVWGAGREGRAALAALHALAPSQRIGLVASADEIAALPAALAAQVDRVDPATAQGRGLLDRCDAIIKSPGVSPYRPPLAEHPDWVAKSVSGTALWLAEPGRAPVIAVTGTKGKSTSSALIAHLLRSAGCRVGLAGNIGLPLLEVLRPEFEPDYWVIELSSFQTAALGRAPEIAVLLNLYPEHLDWHGSVARYYADKLRLFGSHGTRPSHAIAIATSAFAADADAVVALSALERSLRAEGLVPERFGGSDGWHPDGDAIVNPDGRRIDRAGLPLPGRHNALNLCAALTVLERLDVDVDRALGGLGTFRALPHRLQELGERDRRRYVNDSIATTPHASLAALAHYRAGPTVLIAGGHDRGLDWSEFAAALAAAPIHAVIATGANGERIAALLAAAAPAQSCCYVADFDAAVAAAVAATPEGGVVLLSPGAPSFGAFRDYVERGRRFAQLTGFDPDAISGIGGMGIA